MDRKPKNTKIDNWISNVTITINIFAYQKSFTSNKLRKMIKTSYKPLHNKPPFQYEQSY